MAHSFVVMVPLQATCQCMDESGWLDSLSTFVNANASSLGLFIVLEANNILF
jgi:hypothetical protein